jgi:hypothetical protein
VNTIVCDLSIAAIEPTLRRSHVQGMDPTTKRRERPARELDALLDEALRGTFPASDPIAVGHPTGTEPAASPIDRRSPLPDEVEMPDLRRGPRA